MPRSSMISVALCTSGRSSTILACVQHILDARLGLRELIVVDQNRDRAVQELLAPFQDDPRFRYYRFPEQNKGLALNFGIRIAAEDIVAITDDDCLVAPDWLWEYQKAFANYPEAAVAFGYVAAAAHSPEQGYIPDSKITENRRYTKIGALARAQGIGANMAVRRSMVLPFGAFDPSLSPGGRFFASEDRDIAIRSILNGYEVHELAGSIVEHLGFRDWSQGRVHTERDWIGIGAMCAKLVRYHRRRCGALTAEIFLQKSLLPCIAATLKRENPKGFIRVSAFLRGFQNGWRAETDAETLLFHLRESPLVREALTEARREVQPS